MYDLLTSIYPPSLPINHLSPSPEIVLSVASLGDPLPLPLSSSLRRCRYAHLIKTDWDRQFLLNPAFTGWFNTQMSTNPIGPDEPLVDYVRARIAGQREGNGNGAPAPVAVAVQAEDVEEEAEEQTPEPNSAPLVTKADDDLDFFDMTSYAPDEASSSEHIDVSNTPSYGNSPPAAVDAPTIEEDEPSPFHSYSTTTPAAHLHHSSLLNHASSTINDTSTATSSTSTSSAHYDSSASINLSSMVDGSSINPLTISEPAPAPRKTEGEGESESLKVQRQLVKQEQKRVAEQEAQGQPASKKRVAAAVVKSAPKPAVVQKKVVPVSRLGTKASKPAPAPAPAAVSVGSSDDDEPPSASESWSKILPTLRESLTATRFTRATTSTVSKIVKILLEFQLPASGEEVGDWGDGSQVPPEGRGEVLDALLRFGGEEGGEVWKAMLGPGGEGSLEVLQSWLVGGAMSLLAGKKEERAKGREAQGTLGRVLKVSLVSLDSTFGLGFRLLVPGGDCSAMALEIRSVGVACSARVRGKSRSDRLHGSVVADRRGVAGGIRLRQVGSPLAGGNGREGFARSFESSSSQHHSRSNFMREPRTITSLSPLQLDAHRAASRNVNSGQDECMTVLTLLPFSPIFPSPISTLTPALSHPAPRPRPPTPSASAEQVISRLSLTLDHLRKYKKIAGRVKKVSGKAVDAGEFFLPSSACFSRSSSAPSRRARGRARG